MSSGRLRDLLAKSLAHYQGFSLGIVRKTGFSIFQHQTPLSSPLIVCKTGHCLSCLTTFQGRRTLLDLPGAYWFVGFPQGLQPPSDIHLLWPGVLHRLQVGLCSPMELHGLQVDSPWSAPWNEGKSLLRHQGTSSPSFCALCLQGCFSHIFSLLFRCSCAGFLPSFKYVIPDVLPPLLMGLIFSSGGSVLELPVIGSVDHQRNFCWLLSEAPAVASPATKILSCKSKTGPQLTDVKQRKS